MHPYMIEELACQRERELRRSAKRYALVGSRGRRRRARQRAGHLLARIGLALPARAYASETA
jgi:hypothetical protein